MNLSQQKRERMLSFLKQLKTETKTDEDLIALNEIENELLSKKYGLIWEQHEENVDIKMKTEIPVFTEIEELKINDNKESDYYNFLLEGDNLHSLKLLEKTHRGKIGLIYIDPPYNTGNKDFIYEDSMIGQDDGFRHSKWLSFMSERLIIASKLLSDEGMILISIDDNEFAQLKLLCDEIFGENNLLANMVWQSTPGSNTGTNIITVTEYILVYAKNKAKCKTNTIEINDDTKYKLEDEYVERRGRYVLNKMDRRMTGSHYSDSLNYPIEMPDGQLVYPGSTTYKSTDNWNYRWSKPKIEWGIENGFIVFKNVKGKWNVYFKQYYKVDNNDNIIQRRLPFQNLVKLEQFNSTQGTREIMTIFNGKKFDYPKPLGLIKYLIDICPDKNITVLDFFAGSGTTGHAVLQLNAEDKGNRRFILCTNNENNICREITYERVRAAILGKCINNEELNKPLLSNLKYYKTDFIPKISNDNYYLSDELLKHIKEMVQLENGVALDGENYILLLSDEEADILEKKPNKLKNCKGIYISSDVFLTSSQQKLFRDIEIKQIPDYYFEDELREVGEIW